MTQSTMTIYSQSFYLSIRTDTFMEDDQFLGEYIVDNNL